VVWSPRQQIAGRPQVQEEIRFATRKKKDSGRSKKVKKEKMCSAHFEGKVLFTKERAVEDV
jgi:hypothetical protein